MLNFLEYCIENPHAQRTLVRIIPLRTKKVRLIAPMPNQSTF